MAGARGRRALRTPRAARRPTRAWRGRGVHPHAVRRVRAFASGHRIVVGEVIDGTHLARVAWIVGKRGVAAATQVQMQAYVQVRV